MCGVVGKSVGDQVICAEEAMMVGWWDGGMSRGCRTLAIGLSNAAMLYTVIQRLLLNISRMQ
jgi:hypothetical protein